MATGLLTRGLGLPETPLVTGGLGLGGGVIPPVVPPLDQTFPKLNIQTLTKVDRLTIRPR